MGGIELERRDDVAVLWLGDGENRVDTAFVDQVGAALDEIEGEGATALVTAGAGKCYSNGFDLDHIRALGPGAEEFLTRCRRLLARLLTLGVPTVAAVNGHAFGMGAMMALAHDRRLMRSDRGWISFPEVALGLRLHPAMNLLVSTRLGDRTALEALTTARRYDGEAALAGGWVTATAPAETLVERAVEEASAWAGQPPASVATIKADLYAPLLSLLA